MKLLIKGQEEASEPAEDEGEELLVLELFLCLSKFEIKEDNN